MIKSYTSSHAWAVYTGNTTSKATQAFVRCRLTRCSGVPLISRAILAETQQTLALLFPQSDKDLVSWYKREASQHDLDQRLLKLPTLELQQRQIDCFDFWRDRLVMLKTCYNEAQPLKPKQLFYDRRDGPRFFQVVNNVAILMLTLVTIAFGAAQLAFAVKQYDQGNGRA